MKNANAIFDEYFPDGSVSVLRIFDVYSNFIDSEEELKEKFEKWLQKTYPKEEREEQNEKTKRT